MPNLLLAIVNFLHLLATIVWIGGMIIARLIITPALAGLPDETRRPAMHAIGRRDASFTYGTIVIFLITGLTMLSKNANYSGLLVLDSTWTRVILLKHLAVAALIISTAYANTAIARHLLTEDATDHAAWAERRKDLADVNLLLGLTILGLTAIATAIPPAGE
jgi:putative copper resistance protein D